MRPRVVLAGGSPAEEQARGELLALLDAHGLDRWCFTDEVVIEEGASRRAHPVLTLGTAERGAALLGSYLHEQIHRFVADLDAAVAGGLYDALCDRYPEVPVGDHEGGPGGEVSTRLHLVVCWLEWDALRRVLGPQDARAVVERSPRYPWVYRTVLDDDGELGLLLSSYGVVV